MCYAHHLLSSSSHDSSSQLATMLISLLPFPVMMVLYHFLCFVYAIVSWQLNILVSYKLVNTKLVMEILYFSLLNSKYSAQLRTENHLEESLCWNWLMFFNIIPWKLSVLYFCNKLSFWEHKRIASLNPYWATPGTIACLAP